MPTPTNTQLAKEVIEKLLLADKCLSRADKLLFNDAVNAEFVRLLETPRYAGKAPVIQSVIDALVINQTRGRQKPGK